MLRHRRLQQIGYKKDVPLQYIIITIVLMKALMFVKCCDVKGML